MKTNAIILVLLGLGAAGGVLNGTKPLLPESVAPANPREETIQLTRIGNDDRPSVEVPVPDAQPTSEFSPETMLLPGLVEPQRTFRLRARVSGQLHVSVEVGDAVKPGDCLMQVNSDEIETRIRRQKAKIDALRVSLEASRYAAAAALVEKQSDHQLMEVGLDSEIESAKHMLNAELELLEELKLQRDHHVLTAPFDGKVLTLLAGQREFITVGETLGTLASRSLRLKVHLPKEMFRRPNSHEFQVLLGDSWHLLQPTELSGSINADGSRTILLSIPQPCHLLPGEVIDIHVVNPNRSIHGARTE